MAKMTYGSWSKAADEHGKLNWSGADGKAGMAIDCAALVGGKKVWDSMDASGKFVLAYGAKQWASDGMAGKADTMAEYRALLADRIQSLMAGEAVTGGYPYGVEAIAKVKGIPVEKVRETWAKATDEQRATWYKLPAVQAAVKQIKAEIAAKQAKATVGDAAAGLDEFK